MDISEKDLQALIESAIAEETFTTAIDTSVLTAEARADRWRGTFGADFLLRRKLLSSARFVLDALEGAEIISITPKNISLTQGDRLLPDLVLVNREQARLIIVEIKRSASTSREALTELAAYEQEVRNLLPFASDLELVQVIISTDFPTLLDHGVAGMAMWTSRQILCLQVTTIEPALQLAVHLPSAWSPMVQGELPADAVRMHTLVLYDADESKVDRALTHACDLIARNGERKGTHGFLIAWRRSGFDQARFQYFISVAFLSPFAFLPHSVDLEMIDIPEFPLGTVLLAEARDLAEASGISFEIAETAVATLRAVSNPLWEDQTDWVNFRQPPSVVGDRSYRTSCEPLRTDFWGALGDFVVQRDPALSWKDWRVGVAILDEIFGLGLVRHGRPTFAALLDLGAAFGALYALLDQFESLDDPTRDVRRAPMAWAAADIAAALREITEGAPEAVRKTAPRTGLRFGDPAASRTAITSFVRWVADELTGESYPLHRIVFQAGYRGSAALERYVTASQVEPAVLTPATTALADDARVLLTMIATLSGTESLEDEARKQFVAMVGAAEAASGEEIQEAIHQLDDDSATEMMVSSALPALLDTVFAPLPLREDDLKGEGVDWAALRQQMQKIAAQGSWKPVLVIDPTGDVFLARPSEDLPLPMLADPETEVIVVYRQAQGFEVARREKWDELSSREVIWPVFPNAHGSPSMGGE